MRPTAALLFAAGFGTRMAPLTQDRPKPLIPVGGKTLLDRALALVDRPDIEPVVVNAHYKADMVEAAVKERGILISDERDALLETGGGLKKALPLLGGDTAFTLNTDAVWAGGNPVEPLLDAWQPERMDCLLLLVPRRNATGHKGAGDFDMAPDGRLERGNGAVYTGLQIIKTAPFAKVPKDAFSMWEVWSDMLGKGRMFGVLFDGAWCDVGQPSSIPLAEKMLEQHNG